MSTRISHDAILAILETHKAEILDALQPAMDAAVHEVAKPLADAILDLLIELGDDAPKYARAVIAAQRAVLNWEGRR